MSSAIDGSSRYSGPEATVDAVQGPLALVAYTIETVPSGSGASVERSKATWALPAASTAIEGCRSDCPVAPGVAAVTTQEPEAFVA